MLSRFSDPVCSHIKYESPNQLYFIPCLNTFNIKITFMRWILSHVDPCFGMLAIKLVWMFSDEGWWLMPSRPINDDDGQWRTSSLAHEGIRRNERSQTGKFKWLVSHVKPTRVWGRLQNPAGWNERWLHGLLAGWSKLGILGSISKQCPSRVLKLFLYMEIAVVFCLGVDSKKTPPFCCRFIISASTGPSAPFIHWCICLFMKQTFTHEIEISVPTDPSRQLFFLSRVESGMVASRSSILLYTDIAPQRTSLLILNLHQQYQAAAAFAEMSPSKWAPLSPSERSWKPELKSSPTSSSPETSQPFRSERTLKVSSRIGTLTVF